MDGVSAIDNSQQDFLWQLLLQKDQSGGASQGRGTDSGYGIQGMKGQDPCCQGQNSGAPQNGMTYNNSGLVINININFNFVNAMA